MTEDLTGRLLNLSSPYVERLGLRLLSATPDEVTAALTVDPDAHFHPWNAVHGGVYCAIVETLATLGAQLSAIPAGKLASGIENHTSFLRQVRGGELWARAVPVSRGRQLHLWDVRITDEQDRVVATGRVRLALLDPPASA